MSRLFFLCVDCCVFLAGRGISEKEVPTMTIPFFSRDEICGRTHQLKFCYTAELDRQTASSSRLRNNGRHESWTSMSNPATTDQDDETTVVSRRRIWSMYTCKHVDSGHVKCLWGCPQPDVLSTVDEAQPSRLRGSAAFNIELTTALRRHDAVTMIDSDLVIRFMRTADTKINP